MNDLYHRPEASDYLVITGKITVGSTKLFQIVFRRGSDFERATDISPPIIVPEMDGVNGLLGMFGLRATGLTEEAFILVSLRTQQQ